MSTEYGKIKGPHDISLTGYYGGVDKGRCMQLLGGNCDGLRGYIGMTEKEARLLILRLREWLDGTLMEAE